jgi:hypothetical protein
MAMYNNIPWAQIERYEWPLRHVLYKYCMLTTPNSYTLSIYNIYHSTRPHSLSMKIVKQPSTSLDRYFGLAFNIAH